MFFLPCMCAQLQLSCMRSAPAWLSPIVDQLTPLADLSSISFFIHRSTIGPMHASHPTSHTNVAPALSSCCTPPRPNLVAQLLTSPPMVRHAPTTTYMHAHDFALPTMLHALACTLAHISFGYKSQRESQERGWQFEKKKELVLGEK